MDSHPKPLAVLGLSCRVPGANSPAEFWELIKTGRDATGELSNDVIDRELYFDPEKGVRGKSYSCVGGLVERLPFDDAKCRLPKESIESYDPAHLTTCEVASDSFRDAGLDPFDLPTKNVGVYIGHAGGTNRAGDIVFAIYAEQVANYLAKLESLAEISPDDKQRLIDRLITDIRGQNDHRELNDIPNLESSSAAQLISIAFGLEGPSMVIDAACASSMQALAVAGRALQQGDIDIALVGGASVCKKESLILFSAAQSVTNDKSRPFDEAASGLVASEGYITVVLKTLEAAVRDGDPIRCVIRGVGMSADGKGKSLWAPLSNGQKLAVQRAYEQCEFTPADIQYVEAHATSTQVGDATEISSLAETFPQPQPGQAKIALGSVKANVGHTLEAAGMAGLVKAILAMEHGTIPPCANLENPNSSIDWSAVPFDLPRLPRDWRRPAEGETRKAAVNSFGIGGLNVHVVLEEYLASKPASYYGIVEASQDIGRSDPVEPIAVVGMGTILPGAQTPEEYWKLLKTGEDPKCEVPIERWDADRYTSPIKQRYRSISRRGGFIRGYQYDWRSHKVPPKQVANANPLQFELLDAADRALKSSGYSGDKLPRDKVGVVVGSVFGGEFANQLQVGLRLPELKKRIGLLLMDLGITIPNVEEALQEFEERILEDMPALLDETGSFTSSTLASRITKTFDLKGGALSLDSGMTTGLSALSVCLDTLRSGDCDIMLCAVGERSMDLVVYEGLTRQDVLAGSPGCADFDNALEGIVPGEGCGVLVLKRLSDAESDQDDVLAVVRSVGCSGDWKTPGKAIGQAVHRAWENSGVQSSDFCLMDIVGSIPRLEKLTVDEIAVLCSDRKEGDPLLVSSIVSQFGFMGANHSMASTIKACLSLEHNKIPAGVATRNPREGLFPKAGVKPVQEEQKIDPSGPTAIGIVCGADKGMAYHAVIDTAPKAAEQFHQESLAPLVDSSEEFSTQPAIFRIGAGTWEDLKQKLESTTVEQLLQSQRRFLMQDRIRLAFVTTDSKQLQNQLSQSINQFEQLQPQLRDRWAESGVFFGQPRADLCSTAFLFPGLGSQYPGMFKKLIESDSTAAMCADQVQSAFELIGLGPLPDLIGNEAEGLAETVWRTQASMLVSSWIVDRTLRDRGFRPGVVGCHSFGEYAAITSAGGWSITDAIRASLHRARALEESAREAGHMVATSASLEIVEEVLSTITDAAYIANINCHNQLVLAGTSSGMEEASRKLKARRQAAIKLSVPCPFHTPLLEPVAENLLARLRTIPLEETSVPVISTAGLGEMTTREQLIQSLGLQLVTKVDFPEILSQLSRHRPALAVEVGPKQVLTRLGRKNCSDSNIIFMASDNSQRPAVLAIADIQAQAECLDCMVPGSHAKTPAFRGKRGDAQFVVFDATEKRRDRLRSESRRDATASGEDADDEWNARSAQDAPSPTTASISIRSTAMRSDSDGYSLNLGASNGTLEPNGLLHRKRETKTDVSTSRAAPVSEVDKEVECVVSATPVVQQSVVVFAEIRKMLIDLVIEQTGYPDEMIELDADLEADLGIDSIKKAQLFGEVGSHFRIAPRDNLSLDDFPTLGHILDFLSAELADSNRMLSNESVAQEVTEDTSELGPLVSTFDHTEESKSGSVVVFSESEVRRVLVDFVIEQTGYPEEMIQLDVDLEADLGIDSIKKAQLFGEVGKRFHIAPRDELSLEDFPTLRHVLDFLKKEFLETSAPTPSIEGIFVGPSVRNNLPHQEEGTLVSDVGSINSIPSAGDHIVRIVELYGTADQRGRQYGETLRDEVRTALARMLDSWSEPLSQTTTHWPCALNDALTGAALGADVNQQVVTNFNQQWHSTANWACEFGNPNGRAARAPHLLADVVVHVHHEVEQLSYLGIAEVGQIHIRAGVNAARLAVSCESLTPETTASDIVTIMGRLHQVLAKATTVATAKEMLADSSLVGQWCLGLNGVSATETSYIYLDGGGQRPAAADQPSMMQRRFHQSLSENPSALRFHNVSTGSSSVVPLEEYLPEPNGSSAFESTSTTSTVMKRWVLRTMEESLPPGNPRSACQGHKFGILGEGEGAQALVKLIADYGGISHTRSTMKELIAAFDGEAPENLILTIAADGTHRTLTDGCPAKVLAETFQQVQLWMGKVVEELPQQEVTLSMLTRLGGDFGFAGPLEDYTGGGLAGLAKALRRELSSLKVKVLDCDKNTSKQEAAHFLLEELASGAKDAEVAYRDQRRHVVQAVAAPASETSDANIQSGSVWVCTGGGRGVTSIVARELGRRFNLKMNLIGTSAFPTSDALWRGKDERELKELKRQLAVEAWETGKSPVDEWNRIEKAMELDTSFHELDNAGVQWHYHCCDVANREQLDAVLKQIRREQGPIAGVIHGAGYEAACRFQSKTPENVFRTIASKCDGAVLLMELTEQDSLRYFVSFGSTSGRFGGLGQADYSLASDMLAKLTSTFSQQRPEVKTVCFHWPAWGDVGMAMRPESRMALETRGITYMAADEGVQHLVNELLSTETEREVLILDEGRMLDTDKTMSRKSNTRTLPPDRPKVECAESSKSLVVPTKKDCLVNGQMFQEFDVINQPLIDKLVPLNREGTFEATCLLDPAQDPFLIYHRFRDRPFLPGVITMEMMAEAAQLVCPNNQFIGLSNVSLQKGVFFDDHRPREVRLRMQKTETGVDCKLITPLTDSSGNKMREERVYASAMINFGALPEIEAIDPGEPIFGWSPFYYPEEIIISHGSPMQSLYKLDYKHGGGRAKLKSGSFFQILGDRQPRGLNVASLALDGAMVCCGFYGFCMLETSVGLPSAIGSYRQLRLPDEHETCTLRFFYKGSSQVGEHYDFTLLGESGDVIFSVTDYQTVLVLDTD